MKVCKIEGCDRPSKVRDLCRLHYQRLLRSSPLPPLPRHDKSIDLSLTPNGDLGYMAGIVDGEGTVAVSGIDGCSGPRIYVTNTSLALIKWLELNFGGHISIPSTASKRAKSMNHKLAYRWCSSTKASDVYEILSFINPYLVIKREQARLVMELCQTVGTTGTPISLQTRQRRREIKEELYLLNAKGSPTYQTETAAKRKAKMETVKAEMEAKKTEIEIITNDL